MRIEIGILALMLLSPLSLVAQDVNQDGLVAFLVPINVPERAPGAFGSIWQTELWVHNGTDEPVKLAGCGSQQTIPGLPCETNVHPPGVTQPAFPHEAYEYFPALLFQMGPPEVDGLVFSSRLFERSRQTQPVGVELPVVREDQFFTATSRFIALPGNSNLRAALRVYDPRRRFGSFVRVELSNSVGDILGERLLPFVYRGERDVPGTVFVADLAALFPEVQSLDRYDIRVTPLEEGMEYWAMASVTDNDAQQVFTITANQ